MIDNVVANREDVRGLENVHLQWFADEDGDTSASGGGQTDDANIEDKMAELEKQLEAEKKRASGNDKKVGELLSENKKLRETSSREDDRKRKIAESKSLTVEDWQREFDKKVDEMEVETQRRINQIEEENKKSQFAQNIYRIAPKIEGLPPDVIKLLTVSRDADEETLTEIMQTVTDNWTAKLDKQKLVLENKGRIGSRPGTGGTSSKDIPSDKEWEKYSYDDRKNWVHFATDEQLKKAQDKGLNI